MPRHDTTSRKPSGRSQSTRSTTEQLAQSVRKHPVATAAAAAGAAGAVAAGAYLWSRRREVGEQMSRIGRKASDWAGEMTSGKSNSSSRSLVKTKGPNESSAIEASRATAAKSRKSSANVHAGRAGAETVSY